MGASVSKYTYSHPQRQLLLLQLLRVEARGSHQTAFPQANRQQAAGSKAEPGHSHAIFIPQPNKYEKGPKKHGIKDREGEM